MATETKGTECVALEPTGLGRWRNIFVSNGREGLSQQYLIRATEMPSVCFLPLLCKGSKARSARQQIPHTWGADERVLALLTWAGAAYQSRTKAPL